jgi:peptidoglycan/LPS O-acetylase OafA/YrhL
LNYRPEIDGLRAIAILPVIFYHAGIEIFNGGYVGVDIFFVVSGYLITTIILKELDEGKFSIINFYERRIRRIIPALFAVMFVSIIFAYFLLLPNDIKDFSQSLVAVSTFVSNILFWRESGYFDTSSELKPLLHTWSLAVEEQFYILFPLFLLIFWKKSKFFTLLTLFATFVFSLVISNWAMNIHQSAAFYLLPTRGWELLMGAFAGFYLSKKNLIELNNNTRELLNMIGFILILFSIFFISKKTPFPIFAFFPVLGTFMIILFATKHTIVGKFLSNKYFVSLGLISYSLYLWHQPIFAFARNYTFNILSFKIIICLIVLSIFLSFISYKHIEKPFRKKNKISQFNIFLIFILGTFFFIIVGVLGHFKDRFSGTHTQFIKAIGDWEYPSELNKTSISGYYKFNSSKSLDVLFFGDSHAQQFQPLTKKMSSLGLNSGFLSGGGCPPIPNLLEDLHPHCRDLFKNLYKVLDSEENITKIVIAGCFNCYFINQSRLVPNPDDKYNYYYLSGEEKFFFRTSKGKGQQKALISFADFIKDLSKKYKVILIGDNPSSINFNPKVMMAYEIREESIFFKKRYPKFINSKFKIPKNQIILDEQLKIKTQSFANYLSLRKIVCPDEVCYAKDEKNRPIYKDADHMRPYFVREVVGPYLLEYLK